MNSAPLTLAPDDPLAVRVVETIRSGDVQSLHVLLAKHPGLVQARIGDPNTGNGSSRTLLHVVTDWPGKYPNGPEVVRLLVSAGADVIVLGCTHYHWIKQEIVEAVDDRAIVLEPSEAIARCWTGRLRIPRSSSPEPAFA